MAREKPEEKRESLEQTAARILRGDYSAANNLASATPDGNTQTNDRAVLGFCELLALMFGLPAGEALFRGDPISLRMIGFGALGVIFAVLGPAWPTLRRKFPQQGLVLSLGHVASEFRYWLVLLLLIFIYVAGPEIYQRAIKAAAPRFVQPSVEEIDKATAPFRAQIDNLKRQLAEERQRRTTLPQTTPQQPTPQSPQPKMSAEDVETQISIWESVSTGYYSALVNGYNSLDLALSRWQELLSTADDRQHLYNDLASATSAYMRASFDLETLRSEYPKYQDVNDALAQPNIGNLEKAAHDFSNAISAAPPLVQPGYEIKLRPLAGALRREMNLTQAWLTALSRTANQKRRELGNVK